MEKITLKAPAKLNLTLDVTGRRGDGYHNLEMIMQTVALHNVITVQKKAESGIFISCTNPDVPCDERNLCHKAALRFFEECGLPVSGLSIHIEKHIPMEAGLAGGSTDAAAVLKALNAIFGTGLGTKSLCEIGVKVGADVPFCIVGGTALCCGVGEIITPLAAMPDCRIVIAKPQEGMKTPECFKLYDMAEHITKPDTYAMKAAIEAHDIAAVARNLGNVLEQVMVRQGGIKAIKTELLKCGALGASMTGSGTAVFGIFDDENSAKKCAEVLKLTYKDVFLTKPCK